MGKWLTVNALCVLTFAAAAPADVPRFGVYETDLQSAKDYANPFQDPTVKVKVIGPGGATQTIDAFWDGGRTWRLRFSPSEVGTYRWRSECSDTGNAGLHGRTGTFKAAPYTGDNPLLQHGPVQLSQDRRHLVYADGTPFFWLADTAWNGALRSTDADWIQYLDQRKQQRFTAIQFVTTQWRGGSKVLGQHAFKGTKNITIDPTFFQRLDRKVQKTNDRGLVAAPVMLWALTRGDPGQVLAEADQIKLARYMVARWGAHQVVWMLSGDCPFRKQNVERWQRVGRAVFNDRRDRLVTLHPSGQNWIVNRFKDEDWYDFVGYQSGHGDGDGSLKWHLREVSRGSDGTAKPTRPIINLEPNYETHPGYHSKKPHPPLHVRRAAWWSLLISPPAGVTYGHNAIWVWNTEPGPAENHGNVGTVQPWSTGLQTRGLAGMTIMRDYFESGPWTKLRPAQQLIKDQPGANDPKRYVTAATTADGAWTVVYMPIGGPLTLDTKSIAQSAKARWFNPRNGEYKDAGKATGRVQTFKAPDQKDWVLDVRRR